VAEWAQILTSILDNPPPIILHLFGGPFVTVGRRRTTVPEGGKRLLAFVALHKSRVDRRYAERRPAEWCKAGPVTGVA
jgi:hypothetical protein